jgi:hypothetical protein
MISYSTMMSEKDVHSRLTCTIYDVDKYEQDNAWRFRLLFNSGPQARPESAFVRFLPEVAGDFNREDLNLLAELMEAFRVPLGSLLVGWNGLRRVHE